MNHDTTPSSAPPDASRHEGQDTLKSASRGPQNVMIVLLCLALAGTCFLVSAGAGTEEGHQPWKPTSLLRHVTTLLNLSGDYPTPHGTEVKWLVQGLAAAAALLATGYAFWLRTRRDEDIEENAEAEGDAPGHRGPASKTSLRARMARLPLVTAAQIAMGVFVGYMALSSIWAPWLQGSFGDSMIRLTAVIWAICLARVLCPRKGMAAIVATIVILALMAALGIWYHYERAPLHRLKFPIGNPIFLAAVLLPGMILAISFLAASVTSRFAARSASDPSASRGSHLWHNILIALGSIAALLIMGWAMILADSRGPAVGMAGGLFLCLLVIVSRRARWGVLGVTALLIAASWMTGAWPKSWLESRPTTVRFRLYAWSYARDLFYARPDIGHGQGAYVLKAQAPSRADALQDPDAFTTDFLGHAHNEWLEILADLGAIGFALIATSLALTLYAALVALRRRPKYMRQWWMILGLAGALMALMIEECFNVGLRVPAVPFVFHTILGLLWAVSRTDHESSTTENVTPLLRLGTPTLLSLGAVAVLMVSVANWRATRAENQLGETIRHQRWDFVPEAADRAMGLRWSIEEHITSLETIAWAHHLAARHHGFQLLNMLNRRFEADTTDVERLREIAREDLEKFAFHTDSQKNLIQDILTIAPLYPDVGQMAAEICLLQQDIANELARFQGTTAEVNLIPEAARWLELELRTDRYDAGVALRLVQLAPDASMEQRLDWLRVPLRVSTITPAYERLLGMMRQHPDFWPTLNAWAHIARATTRPAGTTPLPQDAYAPETMRLLSAALKLTGRFEDAARIATEAIDLYAPLRERFPAAGAYTRLEQARCLFLADPANPAAAIEACRQGLDKQEMLPEDSSIALMRALALYTIAAGEEAEARRLLREADPRLDGEPLEHEIARACVELSSLVMGLPPERQPAVIDAWINRAVELAPQWTAPHQLAFNRAIEHNDTENALRHFETLRHIVNDPQLWEEWKRTIQRRHQGNATLQDVFSRAPSTQPAAPAETTSDTDALIPPPDAPDEPSETPLFRENTPSLSR